MKNLKHDLKLTSAANEGWAIHIYDGDRHLRCTLDSSHGRAFGFGLGLGIIAAVVGTNLILPASSKVVERPPAHTSSLPAAASQHSAKDSIFWID